MATRVAESLEQLRRQLNQMAPNRSKVSDGGIGDAAHAARASDHNPDSGGVVHARDFTHDPAGGLDCNWLAKTLTASGDRRIKYIIWNRRIWQNGQWKDYTGSNAHTQHLHLSVVSGAAGDSGAAWNLGGQAEEEEIMAGMHQRDQELLVRAANRVMGILPQRYFQVIDGEVLPCNATDPGAKPCAVLDNLDGAYLVTQLLENRARVAVLDAEVRALRGENVDMAELRAAVDAELKEMQAEWQQKMTARPESEDKT